MEDKEIEVKLIINENIKQRIIEDLDKTAVKVSTSSLIDTYYIPNFKDFEVDGETIECVRIRQNKKGTTLTYKRIHKEAVPIYCDEYETLVENKDQMEKILLALGFKIQMVIDKTRVSYKLDNFEFDFDTVKGLGELLEIELKDNNASIETIYKFVSTYGLSEKDVTNEGIQDLMKKAMKLS